MVRTPSAAIAVAVCALALAPPVSAGVTSRFAPQGRQGTLFVASDGADAIVVTCSGGFVLVNGLAPQTGPLRCLVANRIAVTGGPGDNRIDLAGIEPAQLDGSSEASPPTRRSTPAPATTTSPDRRPGS